MRKQNRLGPLKVGVPREVRVAGSYRPPEQNILKTVNSAGELQELTFGEKPQVRRTLIISASTGVESTAGGTGQFGQTTLDRRVDVFVTFVERKRAFAEFHFDGVERLQHRRFFLGREDSGVQQASDVSARSREIVEPHALIETQALRERHQLGRRSVAEAPMPEC